MRFTVVTATAATVAVVLAAPAAVQYVTHERREIVPPGWTTSHRLDSNAVLPLKIGLAQSNLDRIEDLLMDVSAPESANWGKHWSASKIANFFAPSADTENAVREWLTSNGIAADRIKLSMSKGWLNINATVAEAEKLLQTNYHMYEHEDSGMRQVACRHYKVPEAIRRHIDIITPTVHFDAIVKPRSEPAKLMKRAPYDVATDDPDFGPIVKQGETFATAGILEKKLKNCTNYITPNCLRALYEIPAVSSNLQKNPLGIVEYTPQSYYQPDLDLFFETYSTKQSQTTPNLKSIDGGFVNTNSLGFGDNGESNLDLEYSMTLVNPIDVNLYQTGDAVEGASFDNFLDAIDGSFCTFEGGDQSRDAKYPDPYNYTGAYKGPEACGTFAPPKVVSTSYAYSSEYSLTPFYQMRQCAEYAKLGLAGTSVLYSSGDSGVGTSGTSIRCIAQNATFGHAIYSSDPNLSRFTVSFPSNCPYVTSVGATQVKNNTLITAANPEVAADIPLPQGGGVNYIFSSGGGFSDLFGVPKYQKSAIKKYFKNYKPSYSSTRYNSTGLSRGVPDVSANGANYVISVNGTFSLVYGTSASSPTFASVLTIINEMRKQNGKGSIGFINPMLYANPSILNDILAGNNPNCGTEGFTAVEGWDPLTGLGTPNVPKMLEVFLKMA